MSRNVLPRWGILLGLLGCLTTLVGLTVPLDGCAHTVNVPVPVPVPNCPSQPWEPPPTLNSRACGDDVCIPWREARDLATWIGKASRWHELAQVCLDSRSASFVDETTPPDSFFHLTDMTLRGMVQPRLTWKACGFPNGYYTPADNTVTMCYELLDKGEGVTRFVAAHEMGHAVITQLRIPYTGLQEMAADELAAVILHLTDHQQDVVDASTFFFNLGRDEDPMDPHPSDKRRFVLLWLLANETNYFDHALYAWACLLAPYRL